MLLNFYRWKLFYVYWRGVGEGNFAGFQLTAWAVCQSGQHRPLYGDWTETCHGWLRSCISICGCSSSGSPSLLPGFVCATMATHADMHVVADGNVNYCKSEAEKPTCLYFHMWTEPAFSHAVSFSAGKTHKNLHSLQQNALVQRLSDCLSLRLSLSLSVCLFVRAHCAVIVAASSGWMSSGGWQTAIGRQRFLFVCKHIANWPHMPKCHSSCSFSLCLKWEQRWQRVEERQRYK